MNLMTGRFLFVEDNFKLNFTVCIFIWENMLWSPTRQVKSKN